MQQRYLICLSRWLIVSELKLTFIVVRLLLCNINFQLNLIIQFSQTIFSFSEFNHLTLSEKKITIKKWRKEK